MSNNLDSSAPIDTDSGNSYSYSNSYGDVVDTRTSFSESFSYNVNGNSISYPIYGSTDDNDVNRSSYSNSNNDGNSNSDGNSSKTFSIVVNYYDKKDTRDKERTTIKQLTEQTTTREIVHLVANRISLAPDDRKYYSLVIIITNYNELKRLNVHYLRTLKDDEVLTIVENNMKSYISELLGYDMNDQELVSSKLVIRFYYKDCRTAPIDLKDYGVVVCGDPAFMEDDEEVISHSDLAYLGNYYSLQLVY